MILAGSTTHHFTTDTYTFYPLVTVSGSRILFNTI